MIVALVSALVLAQPAPEFVASRFEMGVRLKRLDAAWVRERHSERHRAAVPFMQTAVQSFFSGQFGKACMALDQATAAVEGRKPKITDAVDLSVDPVVIEHEGQVTVKLTWAYAFPEVATESWQGLPLKSGVTFSKQVNADSRRGGRFEVTTRFGSGESRSVFGNIIPSFGARMEALKTSGDYRVKSLAALINEGVTGQSETAVPIATAIEMAENYQKGVIPKLPVEIPLADFEGVRIRAFIPKKPRAIVVALHGAGGSENMFFESYGAGKAVELAERRQWVFLSPRGSSSAVKTSLKWLKQEFGIDNLPVFVMGHSMGGGLALQTPPEIPKAMALFAPAAGRVPEGLLSVPMFLAVGEQEMNMLVQNADRIADQIKPNSRSEMHRYPNCEHLMVVADAVDDAFAFFDRNLK